MSEGAVHSHARRALAEGHIAAESGTSCFCRPTLGLPTAVKALTWIDDIVEG